MKPRLRSPEVLGPLRGLGIRPLVSVIRGLANPFPEARKGSQGLGEGSSAPRRGVSVFKGAGKEGEGKLSKALLFWWNFMTATF